MSCSLCSEGFCSVSYQYAPTKEEAPLKSLVEKARKDIHDLFHRPITKRIPGEKFVSIDTICTANFPLHADNLRLLTDRLKGYGPIILSMSLTSDVLFQLQEKHLDEICYESLTNQCEASKESFNTLIGHISEQNHLVLHEQPFQPYLNARQQFYLLQLPTSVLHILSQVLSIQTT